MCNQVYKRFPFNTEFIQSLKTLSFLEPSKLKELKSLSSIATSFPRFVLDVNELEREFKLLKVSNICDTHRDDDVINFWKNVFESKIGDTIAYPNLQNLVSHVLCLPHSSAAVERIFSQINLNKTKTRNKLSSETLSGILHSKKIIDKDCYNYQITTDVLKNYKTSVMYSNK